LQHRPDLQGVPRLQESSVCHKLTRREEMSRPIKAGDLVVVLRNHCSDASVGLILRVENVEPNDRLHCRKCGAPMPGWPMVARVERPYGTCYAPLPWLKRIPPLDELDDVKREEESHA
jgi:hypothetical protein